MVRPVFKEPKKELEAKVNENVKLVMEKFKQELEAKADERINAILKEREEKSRKEKAEKIQEAVNVAKSIKEDKNKEGKDNKEGGVTGVATVEQVEHEHKNDEISCPTCKGHVHKAEGDKTGLVYKCTKDGCGFVSVMVDKRSDYKCNNCSMPIKKPEKPENVDGCPFCGGTKAIRFDWGKLWAKK